MNTALSIDNIVDTVGLLFLVSCIILIYRLSNRQHLRSPKGCAHIPLAIPFEVLRSRFQKEIRPLQNDHGNPFTGAIWKDGRFFMQYLPNWQIGSVNIVITLAGIVEEERIYYKFSGISRSKKEDEARQLSKLRELCAPEEAPPPQAE